VSDANPDRRVDVPRLDEEQKNWVELWAKGEDVAMHFNQLIMTFRLRALAALGVAGGVVGTVLLNEKSAQYTRFNYVAFAFAMFFIAVLWLAVAAIDILYYHRLLVGAVEDLLRLEKQSNGVIQLSTAIAARAEQGLDSAARFLFYALPLAALIVLGYVSYTHTPTTSETPASTVPVRTMPSH
jgi:hypothetical protein